MKKLTTALACCVLAAAIFQPSNSFAAKRTISQIDQELKQLHEQARQAQQQQQHAANQKQEAQHYKNKTQQYLQSVTQEISTVSQQLAKISMEIDDTESNLRKTAEALDAANDRIAHRKGLLDSRVRLMYTDGFVSYLDVLMSATSFADFLERVDSLKAIVHQDQVILAENKRDKELVVAKKKDLEKDYAKAKDLYAEAESRRSELQAKEEEKQQLIASYDAKIVESDDASEEQDQLLVQIAQKSSQLQQEKNKLKAEEVYRYNQSKKKKKRTSSSSGSSGSSSFSGGNGEFGMPVPNGTRISSPFGYRIHPITGERKLHKGVDFAVPIGTEVHAAEDGVVIVADWWSGYGNCVIIDHGNGVWSLYGHLSSYKVEKGDQVKRGDVVALSGNTGGSTGPHLHFEVRVNGTAVDPMPYLR
ncbi:M23 family metallopeptidase [Paenibacillus sediminis]|uniref:Murein DD-endopeptidase MepM/ murein hydrolase activator NlpD n=1 Tax=Paenibacillus sediminis TaxID=664909 RepID=A0ABS4H3B7_9BACL|nr:M23 family metallopeptidase [Paenibacillus sediminis]MBP1936625.1 murein DD-endopeptidase MepM/ murein hydrolase activator NlpD [Paenibacillus sediminis]